MALTISFFSVLSITLLILCVSADNLSFTYSGSHGPEKWGSISPYFATCSNGKSQSPVNIVKQSAVHNKNLKPLSRTYSSANATLINSGFNIGVHFEANVGAIFLNGKNYSLKQMHWHSPSEHHIDGQRYAAELHLVHKADDGSLSVVAMLYQYGVADPLLSKLQGKLGELAKEVCRGDEEAHIALGVMDTRYLRKKTRKYYRYVGSLTTPPCSENVIWTILGKVRTISKEQVEALKTPLDTVYKSNARPAQELHGRQIQLYDELCDH